MEIDELRAMLSHDEHHWWYRGRRRVLRAEIGRLTLPCDARILDAGCGSGRTLEELQWLGHVVGVDASPLAIDAARGRGFEALCCLVETLPFADASFDLVTCLDVVEHTPDDVCTLTELRRVTRPGGHVVVTVPAHQALWSHHDVVNRHYRRYGRDSLLSAARAAGFEVVHDTSFNSVALLPAALVRTVQKHRGAAAARSELTLTPARGNRLLELPLALEARHIARGGRVPFGLSLLAVLRAPAVVRAPTSEPPAARIAARRVAMPAGGL